MRINSPADLGQRVRETRTRRGLSQAALAAQLGTTRQWVIALERGNPAAELGRVLKALSALGLRLDLAAGELEAPRVSAAAAMAAQVLEKRTASGTLRRLSTAVPRE